MKSELTPRQWALYNLLRNNPDKRFMQIEIANTLRDEYPYSGDENFHDSAARIAITDDIRAINHSDIIQKVIISDRRGVKLASREEFEKYINGQFAAIFRKLERTRKKAKKGGLDGQMRIAFNNERPVIEAYTDDINRLKAARLAKGLKLVDVVRELRKNPQFKGVDISLLSKMENSYCKPTDDLLFVLARLYGVKPSALVNGETILDLLEIS